MSLHIRRGVVAAVLYLLVFATPSVATPITYQFLIEGVVPRRGISMELRQDVYSIFKETLQNVMKHARASHVTIRVSFGGPYLNISVLDDGHGFEESRVQPGNGLASMRARATKHGAELRISSAPGNGARIDMKVIVV